MTHPFSHAYRMLIGACNPTLCPIYFFFSFFLTWALFQAAKITYNLSLTMSVCNDKGAKPGAQRSHHLWMRPVPRS